MDVESSVNLPCLTPPPPKELLYCKFSKARTFQNEREWVHTKLACPKMSLKWGAGGLKFNFKTFPSKAFCGPVKPVVRSVRVCLCTLTFHGYARLRTLTPQHSARLCTLGLGDTEVDLLYSHAQVPCRKKLVLVEFLFKSTVCRKGT